MTDMQILSNKLVMLGDEPAFWCPGCKDLHRVPSNLVSAHPGPKWTWNEDVLRPTWQPSILVRSGHYVPGHDPRGCWCTYNANHPGEEPDFVCVLCHSFVTDGRIQFLSDTSHHLSGQTVDIPDLPDYILRRKDNGYE